MDYIPDNPTPDRFLLESEDNRKWSFSLVTQLWVNVVNYVDSSEIASTFFLRT